MDEFPETYRLGPSKFKMLQPQAPRVCHCEWRIVITERRERSLRAGIAVIEPRNLFVPYVPDCVAAAAHLRDRMDCTPVRTMTIPHREIHSAQLRFETFVPYAGPANNQANLSLWTYLFPTPPQAPTIFTAPHMSGKR